MLSDFVGIPFLEQGRALKGADCWGLLCLVYRRELALELPSYSGAYVTTQDRATIAGLLAGGMGDWREVDADAARPLDAVLMREGGQACHVGVMAPAGLVLHTEPGRASIMVPLWKIRRRVVGFYRHASRFPK